MSYRMEFKVKLATLICHESRGMVSRHVLQENHLYIIRKESKGTPLRRGEGFFFFAGVAIWPPRTEQQIKLSAI